MTVWWPEIVAVTTLLGVLAFAMAQPRGLPEATAAVPAAVVLVGCGILTVPAAEQEIRTLGPTVAFLAAILVVAELADRHGVFAWLGRALADLAAGSAQSLLGLVFAAASVTTAVLSLDATVVLLTPVVLTTARLVRVPPRPHAYACGRLSNTASTLLPVSNLTNLLAFSATGLTFASFALAMVGPWLVAIAVEYAVFRRFFRADLPASGSPPLADDPEGPERRPLPAFAFVVLALTLLGFGVSGFVGVEPVWVAVAGAVVLAAPLFRRHPRDTLARIVSSASPLFCAFVFALGVIVAAVSTHGLGGLVARVVPPDTGLTSLLMVAAVSGLLANVVNNIPATLLMLSALAPTGSSSLILAMLVGVNIGPNLTYVGSLATLLWRRVLVGADAAPRLGEFTALSLLTVPAAIVGATTALWLAVR